MLLYNQRKEFIGIDEDDLSALDFNNINELQNESHDFADLFVKKPGYIHNFKNFSWIDFILHSESDESKAIIHAKGKNYSCALHITPFHFSSEESGYAVVIKNLRQLKGAEDAQAVKDLEASGGIKASPAPAASATVAAAMPSPNISKNTMPELDISLDDIQMADKSAPSFNEASAPATEDFGIPEPELPNFEESYSQELTEPDPLDIPEPLDIGLDRISSGVNEFGAPLHIDYNAPLDINEDLMKDTYEEPVLQEPAVEETLDISISSKPQQPMLGDYVSGKGDEHLSDLVRSGDYKYDPNVAANELGLPVDLIEEFIGDFIDQAHEFHDDLYASVKAEDFDNVQILSHKLKGVAANLRVEDAFDVLSVVNVSKEVEEILPNLNEFYKIIAKLEGKEIPQPAPTPIPEAAPEPIEETPLPVEEDEHSFGIKQPEEGPLLIDEDVLVDDDDDIYGDLLGTPSTTAVQDEAPSPSFSYEDDDDIYGDLLGSPAVNEMSIDEEMPIPTDDEGLYDDLLGTPIDLGGDETPIQESLEIDEDIYADMLSVTEDEEFVQPAPSIDVPALNFDAQRSANELGIPVDIVKDFIQDFKEQINVHQNDFTNAIQVNNIQEINKTATLLKGMSDNLRLNEISEVLKGLQVEKDINNTAEALAKLQAYADQL